MIENYKKKNCSVRKKCYEQQYRYFLKVIFPDPQSNYLFPETRPTNLFVKKKYSDDGFVLLNVSPYKVKKNGIGNSCHKHLRFLRLDHVQRKKMLR